MGIRTIRTFLSHIYHLFFNYKKVVKTTSYYPELELKSHSQIFFDHLKSIIKYGEYEKYYFIYGFDRKTMTKEKMKEYVSPYGRFAKVRDRFNYETTLTKPYNYIIILHDKFIFERYLTSIGLPTPQNKYYIDSHDILDLSTKKHISFDKILTSNGTYFAKPRDGMLGNGIFELKVLNGSFYKDNKAISIDTIKNIFSNCKYLLQEKITQHSSLNELYPLSVNTIRIHTVSTEQGIKVFGATLRIGNNNNVVDNWAKGGIIIGCDIKTGVISKYGFYKSEYGTKIEVHSHTNTTFDGFKVPYFKEVCDLVQRAHKFFDGIHSIGWDIAVTDNGPVIIEANHRWEITLPQVTDKGYRQFIEENFK